MADFSSDQAPLLDCILRGNQSAILLGKAGTGKSTFVRKLVSDLDLQCILLAPTGIAALNMGGQTIHSFFLFPPKPFFAPDKDFLKVPFAKRTLINNADLIIIDEISMVKADLFEALNCALKAATGSNKPFGGKKLLLVGDLHQLPPVVNNQEANLNQQFRHVYDNTFFFGAPVFQQFHSYFSLFEFKTVYRQQNQQFLDALNRLRNHELETEDLNYFNSRHNPASSGLAMLEPYTVMLTAVNAVAEAENINQLAALPSASHIYHAKATGKKPIQPTDTELKLKVGAQIMFIKNDLERRWVNGTIGIITACHDKYITVVLDSGDEFDVKPVNWENIAYRWNEELAQIDKEVIATFQQLPIKLGWAVTIHKAQGLTLLKMHLNLGRGAFAPGQLYVALSRCTTLDGITLTKPLRLQDCIPAIEAQQFYDNYAHKL